MTQDTEQNNAAEGLAHDHAPVVEELAPDARVAELEAEVSGLKDQVLRALAETENTRRRLEQAAEDRARYAVSNFAKDIVTVADNLRRALESTPQVQRETVEAVNTLMVGVEMTERSLQSTFERYGIKQVEALGARFDPNFHEAVMEVPDPSKPAGTVVMVMQTGYTLHGRLLRSAMVGVSKGGPKAGPVEAPKADEAAKAPEHLDTKV